MRRAEQGSAAVSRGQVAVAAIVALVFTAAPTPGDIGGCGDPAAPLTETEYQVARKAVDCERCTACALTSARCARACDRSAPSDVSFPSTCHPLVHDADVCLRALDAASCADYASYVDDAAPAIPPECDFCRLAPTGGTP